MRLLHEWIRHRKEALTFLGTIVFSLTLMFNNDVTQIRTIKAWTVGSVGYLLDKLTVIKKITNTYQENEWLRKKNAELMLENARLKEARFENERLRKLLAFKPESQLDLIPAKVLGRGGSGFINSILVSIGSSDGVKRNMPIVTAQGVAGKLLIVGRQYSTAQLLLDRNFRLSVMVQRSRVSGILTWREGNTVSMAAVPKRSDVKVGDPVVTSGYSSIFPKGLTVGVVSDVQENMMEMFMKIVVKPQVDFTKLEEVFVIRNRKSLTASDQ